MNNRHVQPYLSSSLAIRQEIQRFESVHPSIYAIYDIIELIPDPGLAQQIREHVVCIEGKIREALSSPPYIISLTESSQVVNIKSR